MRLVPPWLVFLIVLGVVLTIGDVVLAVLLLNNPPDWLWSLLSVSPWGPIVLVLSAIILGFRRRKTQIVEHGVAGRARIEEIAQTGSRIGGRAVLALSVSVSIPGRAGYPARVRTAPPYHLTNLIRRGSQLPVLVHAQKPDRLLVDWQAAEREDTPKR